MDWHAYALKLDEALSSVPTFAGMCYMVASNVTEHMEAGMTVVFPGMLTWASSAARPKGQRSRWGSKTVGTEGAPDGGREAAMMRPSPSRWRWTRISHMKDLKATRKVVSICNACRGVLGNIGGRIGEH